MRKLLLAALLCTTVLLQGCFPVVATGVGAGVVAAEDRRTVGTITEDQGIEFKVGNRISDRLGDRTHVNVTSYNRMVLLTGEVPDQKARAEVERIARAVENVRGIVNELTVGPPSALSARANDTYLTSLIKARYVDAQRFNPIHAKVVTEAGTVYLLGLVKRQEAQDAVELTRTTSGVKRVVTVFEYLD